jgi:hypothetical protein
MARTFYGWELNGKFYVSLWPRGTLKQRGANEYATKAEAELECITKRTDARNGAPTIVWEVTDGPKSSSAGPTLPAR